MKKSLTLVAFLSLVAVQSFAAKGAQSDERRRPVLGAAATDVLR